MKWHAMGGVRTVLQRRSRAHALDRSEKTKFIKKEYALLEANFVLIAKFFSRAHGLRQRLL